MFFKRKSDIDKQIKRISKKLNQVKLKDKSFSIFGSSSHKYELKPKVSNKELAELEACLGVELPKHFAAFLLNVGNGGVGPYYGVYSIDKLAKSDVSILQSSCNLHPDMSNDEWNKLIEGMDDDDLSDEAYDEISNKVYAGLMLIGTQGCEYDMYLVIDGPYTGRIVYTSDFHMDHPFFFTYETNFLDWYERWLDEILLDYETSWFGYKMGGNDTELREAFENASKENVKLSALNGMLKLTKIEKSTIVFLNNLLNNSLGNYSNVQKAALQVLSKVSFEEAKKYLHGIMECTKDDERLLALQFIWWYGKAELAEFTEQTKKIIQYIIETQKKGNQENSVIKKMLDFAGYILRDTKQITFSLFAPLFSSQDSDIKRYAVYTTSAVPQKEEFVEIIIPLLLNEDKEVWRSILLYWGVLSSMEILPYYKKPWDTFSDNVNFRKKFEKALEELGLPMDYFINL